MINRTIARDELTALVNAVATQQSVMILYDGDLKDPPGGQTKWMRIAIRHTDGIQATIGSRNGQRRYRQIGIVFVQIYSPLGDGLSEEDRLAIEVIRALRGVTTTSGVLIRNVRAEEAGPDGAWHRTNVVAEFEYDETE